MKRHLLISSAFSLLLVLLTAPAAAQAIAVVDLDDSTAIAEATIARSPAVQLGFPALRKAMPEFVYPVKAEKFRIEGRVLVEYTVNRRGRAKDVTIIEGIGGGCEDEVKRVLRSTRFQPILGADQKPVATRFLSAFDFRLN